MTSLLSVAIGAEVSLVEITGPSAEFIVINEKGSGEEAALGGEVFLLFSKNFSLLMASLLRSLGDFFFALDPRLGSPVWIFKE